MTSSDDELSGPSTAAPAMVGDLPAGVTHDSLFDGRVTLLQPDTGYRANIDALLLAAFSQSARPARHAVDLGSGVGAVALSLAYLGGASRVTLVECDPRLAALARLNLAALGVSGEVIELDVSDGLTARDRIGTADLVVSNPPFFAQSTGRPRENADERSARSGDLEPFVRTARALLADSKSRLCLVYPARSLQELLAVVARGHLVAKRLRLVHPQVDRPARLALIELRNARPGGLVVQPPLIEWSSSGVRSAELARLIGRRTDDRT